VLDPSATSAAARAPLDQAVPRCRARSEAREAPASEISEQGACHRPRRGIHDFIAAVGQDRLLFIICSIVIPAANAG